MLEAPSTPTRAGSSTEESRGANTPSPSTSGVNRRTSVLFSKKNFRKPPLHLSNSDGASPHTPPKTPPARKGPGRPPKPKAQPPQTQPASPKSSSEEASVPAGRGPASPKRGPASPVTRSGPHSPAGRKRSASAAAVQAEAELPAVPSKRSATVSESSMASGPQDVVFSLPGLPSTHGRRDSFLTYRTDKLVHSSSDSDSYSDSGSSDSSMSDTSSSKGSGSEDGDGTGDGSRSNRFSRRGGKFCLFAIGN